MNSFKPLLKGDFAVFEPLAKKKKKMAQKNCGFTGSHYCDYSFNMYYFETWVNTFFPIEERDRNMLKTSEFC